MSAIHIHLCLCFPLHQVPSVSGRYSHRSNQISFAIAAVSVAAVYRSSSLLPQTLAHFIIGRLLHPCHRSWLHFLLPLYPPLLIISLFLPCLWLLISPFFFVVAFVTGVCPLRSSIFFSVASVYGFWSYRSSFLYLLLQALDITYRHHRPISLPSPPSRKTRRHFKGFTQVLFIQDQISGSDFVGTST